MTTQVAVRLPDDLVGFLDDAVAAGAGRSRAEIVTRALTRERRLALAERDAAILARPGSGDTDLDALASYAAAVSMDDLA
jgi:Arc/MetJ-type ribon-helix-helix transcriptional regulator